jgi:hypothetical protein
MGAGCSRDSDASSLPTSAPSGPDGQSSRPATPSAAADEQAMLGQYQQFWQVSGSPLNDVPVNQLRETLSPYAVDPQLSILVGNVESQRAKDIGTYGDVTVRPAVVSMDGATAKIRDCQDTSKSGQLELKSGRKLTVGVNGSLVNVTMRLVGQTWKVSVVDFASQRC